MPGWYVHLKVCQYVGVSPEEGWEMDAYWYNAAQLAIWAENGARADLESR
ncbi:MAG: hypothetical protein U0556_09880 [Dehalococcoidia bacterium]